MFFALYRGYAWLYALLLVKPEDSAVPLFDTTGIHAQAAVERTLTA